MSTSKTSKVTEKAPQRKPLADYADAQVTPLIAEYAEWIKRNTGVDVDPMSVFLGSALRTRFQQERKATKAAPKPKRAPRKPAAEEA